MAQVSENISSEDAVNRRLPHLSLYLQGAAMLQIFSEEDKIDLLRGIKLYQEHKFKRSCNHSDYDVVWQEGQSRVLHYKSVSGAAKQALFIVPSMINKSYILDLSAEQSFVRWLCAQGLDVYLFDWGVACDDAHMKTVDDVLEHKLLKAAQELFSQQKAQQIHALGYCMGGTLLAGMLQHCGDIFCSNIFLAAPWDFHAGDNSLRQAIQAGTGAALQIIEAENRLPSTWVDNVFASVQIEKSIRKYIAFSKMDQESKQARLFVAVEDWLHEGLDLPGEIGRTCLMDWYGQNMTAKGTWNAMGQAVDLSLIKAPSLVVASENDKLVPSKSSRAMSTQLRACDVMQPQCGHIGMMTSRNAETALWKPLLSWVEKQSAMTM
jgi:polyhydroxyalkanoate synthase